MIVRAGGTFTADAAVAALAAAGAPVPLIVHARADDGLGVARNTALAACRAPVLALVEDDVIVDPGWWTRLTAAWAAPDADAVGTVGGPLTADVMAPRPAWLTDDLLPAFALQIAGAHTFHGGNVSFRAQALRGVGGFFPARGGPGARDWFSDEHLAQEALREAGWGVRGDSAVSAVRRIDPTTLSPRTMVARRARFGAREQLLAGHPRAAGALAAAAGRGAAGAISALARRQPGLATERAARAAQAAGALIGDPLVHRELAPTATCTPFRAAVPAAPPLFSRPLKLSPESGPTALLYHRVADRPDDPLAVHPTNFAAQMAVVAARGHDITVTFDDGYMDNLHAALPILTAHRVPATLFVATGHVASGRSFWWDEVERLTHCARADAGLLRLAIGDDTRAWPMTGPGARAAALGHLKAWLQPQTPELIEAILRELRAWAGEDRAGAPAPDDDRPMTIDELRTFAAAPGMSIGAHTRTHPSLARMSPERQDEEIAGSRDDLKAWLGARPTAFSYPFGVPGEDVDRAVQARVRAAGFTSAVVNDPRPAPVGTEAFAAPRHAVPDVGGGAFAAWLDQL